MNLKGMNYEFQGVRANRKGSGISLYEFKRDP